MTRLLATIRNTPPYLRLYFIQLRSRRVLTIMRGYRPGPILSTNDYEPVVKQLQEWSVS